MKKRTFLLITILTIGYFQSCISTTVNPEITKTELYNHINYLASESLKGRYPGTPEDKLAAEYISNQFKKYKLELLFNDGLQAFEISNKLKLGTNNGLQLLGEKYKVNEDFIPISFSSNIELESEVVFVSYGFNIKTNDFSWNDYENIDVKGKWVLIFRGEPNKANASIPFGMYSSLRSKATIAKDAGAAGVIFVSGESFAKEDNLITLEKPEGNINIPVIHIKRELADKIIKKSGKSISTIESEITNGNVFQSFNTNTFIKCKTDVVADNKTTYNIAAQLITDKNNPRYIVIGAHYDHLGYGGIGSGSRAPNENKIHYGADDNASGVSSVLEIAEKLASVKDNLNVNFIFVAFGAEEMGLIGSKYFTNNLPIEDSLIISMINIDMVGRMKDDSSLQISGVGTSLEGESILEKLNSEYNFRLGLSKEGYGPSDHSSFYSKDIPVFFFSTGAHMDYHTPGDSIGKINFDGLVKVTNYIYDFAYNMSLQNTLLTFQEAGPKMPKKGQGKTSLKVTLGIMPDFTGVVKNGLRADIVIEGKPAYKSGMLSGDIITAIDGNSVSDIYEYMERLSKLKAGQIITVEVIRNENKEVLIVQL